MSVDFYLDLAHGSFEPAATLLLVEDARQEERRYQESVLTHQRQQLAHTYSQLLHSALDLGGVDVATEKFRGRRPWHGDGEKRAGPRSCSRQMAVQQPCLSSIHSHQLPLPPHLRRTSTATPPCGRSTRFCWTAMWLTHSRLRTPIRRHSSPRARPLIAVQRARC